MFMNESTENLLDKLENELTEIIELDNPLKVRAEVEIVREKVHPIPVRRNFVESTEKNSHPIPAARRLHLLDKKDKNDENEIIQLSSLSSSDSHRNVSQKTVVVAKERNLKPVQVVHETELAPTDETFFVIKHGKWAQDEKIKSDKEHSVAIEIEPKEIPTSPAVRVIKPVQEKSKSESKQEKIKKKASRDRSSSSSATGEASTTFESSETSSSSSEESVKVKKKKSKRTKNKDKKKVKEKLSSDDQATSTENSIHEDKTKLDFNQAIGINLFKRGMFVSYVF